MPDEHAKGPERSARTSTSYAGGRPGCCAAWMRDAIANASSGPTTSRICACGYAITAIPRALLPFACAIGLMMRRIAVGCNDIEPTDSAIESAGRPMGGGWATRRSGEPLEQGFALAVHLRRESAAEAGEELPDALGFLHPVLARDGAQLIHHVRGEIEPLGVDGPLGGEPADRGIDGAAAPVAALQDPVEDAQAVAEARPQEFALSVLPEPADVENVQREYNPRAPATARGGPPLHPSSA